MIDTRKSISETIFCALDLETTGTNAALHMIVEVGIVRFTIDRIIETYESLVNPGVKIPGDVAAIHGISDDMVRGAPRITDILGDISRVIRDSVLVIHNPGFDLSFLGWAFLKGGRVSPRMEAVDTVRIARRAWPGLKNYKLETICEHLRLNMTPHRAIPDAMACMEVFRSAVRKEDRAGRWVMDDLIGYHGNLIRFIRVKGKRITEKGKALMGLRLGAKAEITYEDHSGSVTVRTILPIEFITADGEAYVLAHCYLRDDRRYFNMSRIIDIK
ncbi:MAG TPA: exonuclease domain-containing protein [Spirochaetota bacterium]|nr:exonuclease domain-containing protein [Spirochaetota bacterium]HPC42069.1 exonuclease domain-containing protein [Spirochaetota bacterium]HPL15989.1 exonuclease domain-containing protein [Spirochaetota bacterium]HQF09023.1 exonuclease domain-containing protein [Spirochaetota bacterium]HQH97911.1 exonuclease domain-containing protein [Spirochaetota bacterium]